MSYSIEQFYLFFQGALIFQAAIFSVIYFITFKKDILFYSLYLFAIAIYFFINAPDTFFDIPEDVVWDSQWYDYVNTPVILVSNFFYLLFLKYFFADLTNNSGVTTMFRFLLWSMCGLLILFAVLTFFQGNRQFIYYFSKVIIVFPAAIVAYFIVKQGLRFSGLVAIGLVCTIIGTSLTAWMDILFSQGKGTSIFATTYPFFFIRLGILADMVLYLMAILKKWNYQEKELALQNYKTMAAVDRVRNEISRELHDDIGATLSGIHLYSHMAMAQIEKGNLPSLHHSVETIQHSAADMVNKLKDIVWMNNTAEKEGFTERIKNYVLMMAQPANITPHFDFSAAVEFNRLPADIRYQLYLICKEAVNNTVKHSGANFLSLAFINTHSLLHVMISDNGKGIMPANSTTGNGLENMRKRAEQINWLYSIKENESQATGTTIILMQQ